MTAIKVNQAVVDLGLMVIDALTLDQNSETYRHYNVSTNGNDVTSLSLSNFPSGAQAVVVIYCTSSAATVNGTTSGLSGAKVCHADISLAVGETAVMTITNDGTSNFASACKYS
jgi:hypothetical protein